jgi:hypothetical protein
MKVFDIAVSVELRASIARRSSGSYSASAATMIPALGPRNNQNNLAQKISRE